MVQMLSDCARIYQSGPLNDERYGNEEWLSWYINSLTSSEKWIIRPAGRGMFMLDNTAVIAAGTTKGFSTDLNLISSLNTVKSDITYRYGLNEESSTFIPKCNLGICTAGDNMEEAWIFLAAAVSENVQNAEHYDGFPVNRNSLQKFYDMNKSNKDDGWFSCGPAVTAEWMDDTEAAEFQSTIEKLSEPVILDTTTHDIIIDVGTQCLEGQLTPEQAVTEITRQLDMRMKE